MDDLISRQQTIEHLKKRLIETALNNTGVKALCDSIFADTAENRIEPWVNELPSAQPERPRGRWIRHPEQKNIYGGKCVECSECSEKYIVQYIEDEKFCRNCGARMDAEEEE